MPAASRRLVNTFVLVAIAVYGGHLCYAMLSDRALFSDGANFFANLIASSARWPVSDDAKHIRLLVNALNQWPVSAARALGVQHLAGLRLLFGAGLFLQPVILYLYCLSLSRRANDHRVFALAIVCLVASAMPSELFAVNQGFTALALAWVVLHYVLLDLRLTVRDGVVLAVVSVLLFRAHEGMVMWGGVTALAAAARLLVLRDQRTHGHRLHLIVLGLLGVAQSAFVLYWQVTHAVQQQTLTFLQLAGLLLPTSMWMSNARVALLALLCVGLLLGSAVVERRRGGGRAIGGERVLTAVVAIAVLTMFASAAVALVDASALDPQREFGYRVLIPFGGAACMMLAAAVVVSDLRLAEWRARLLTLTLAGALIASSIRQAGTTARWRVYQAAAVEALRTAPGPLVSSRTVEAALARANASDAWRFTNPWCWSAFGLSLQADPVVTAIFVPDAEREFFVLPRVATDSVRVPFVTFPARGLLRFEQWTARYLAETALARPVSPAP